MKQVNFGDNSLSWDVVFTAAPQLLVSKAREHDFDWWPSVVLIGIRLESHEIIGAEIKLYSFHRLVTTLLYFEAMHLKACIVLPSGFPFPSYNHLLARKGFSLRRSFE